MPQATLGQVALWLGGELVGDPTLEVHGLSTLADAGPRDITFLANPRYRAQLDTSAAGCVIVRPAEREAAAARGAAIVCADPYLAFARLTQRWAVLVSSCAR